jgi:hypothetical protein
MLGRSAVFVRAVIFVALTCVGASAQQQALGPPKTFADLGIFAPMSNATDPQAALDEIIFNGIDHQDTGRFQEPIEEGASIEAACSALIDLRAAFESYRLETDLLAEGARQGLLKGPPAPVEYTLGYLIRSQDRNFDPSSPAVSRQVEDRHSQLQELVANTATPAFLRWAAQGTLDFEKALSRQWVLIDTLIGSCENPSADFRLTPECDIANNDVRADVTQVGSGALRFLMRLGVRSVHFRCVSIVGKDLSGTKFEELTIASSVVDGLDLSDSSFNTLSFDNVWARGAGIRLVRATVASQLSFTGRDHGSEDWITRIDVTDARVGGDVVVSGLQVAQNLDLSARIDGVVRVTGSRISGILDFRDAALGGLAINTTLIKKFLMLEGTVLAGEFRMSDSEIIGLSNGISLAALGASFGGDVRIAKSEFAGAVFLRSTVKGALQVSNTIVYGPHVDLGAPLAASVVLASAKVGEDVEFNNVTTLGRFDLYQANIGGRLSMVGGVYGVNAHNESTAVVEASTVRLGSLVANAAKIHGQFNLESASIAGGVWLSDLSVGDPAERSTGTALRMDRLIVSGPFSLRGSDVNGTASLFGVQAASLGLVSTSIAGRLVLDSIQVQEGVVIGQAGAGVTVSGDIYAPSLRARTVLLQSAVVGGRSVFWRADVESVLSVQFSVLADRIDLSAANAGEVSIGGLRVPTIVASQAQLARGFFLQNSVADALEVDFIAANLVRINPQGPAPGQEWVEFTAKSATTCYDDSVVKRYLEEKVPGIPQAHANTISPGTAFGCIGNISMTGARVSGDVQIEGDILQVVDFSDANVTGQVAASGMNTRYVGSACIVARGLRADTIEHELTPFFAAGAPARPNGSRGPVRFDMFGAEFRVLRNTRLVNEAAGDIETARSYLRSFIGNGEDCSKAAPAAGAGGSFQPGIYDTLAQSWERMGNTNLARQTWILKNQDYANALQPEASIWGVAGWLTKIVYGLADVISGYGYENIKALIWLGLLWLVGLVVGLVVGEEGLAYVFDWVVTWRHWDRPGGARHRAAVAALRSSRQPRNARGQFVAAKDIVKKKSAREMRAGLFFGLDRSVPTLALDQRFGDHSGLGPYLSAWFYFQRAASFLILILMVAGAFNMFQ